MFLFVISILVITVAYLFTVLLLNIFNRPVIHEITYKQRGNWKWNAQRYNTIMITRYCPGDDLVMSAFLDKACVNAIHTELSDSYQTKQRNEILVLTINTLNPHDASTHHFASLKNDFFF